MPVKNENIWPPPPPADETPADRRKREQEELEAKRVSDTIDQCLRAEKEERRRKKTGPKVLLLGQAESGKSTILKNLQMFFSPHAFKEELKSWCPAIHLNLIRSINFLITVLEEHYEEIRSHPTQSLIDPGSSYIPEEIARLIKRLVVLKPVERALAESITDVVMLENDQSRTLSPYDPECPSEIILRPSYTAHKIRKRSSEGKAYANANDIQTKRVIQACAQDMMDLWAHPVVQSILTKKKIDMHHQSGFFLDDLERIAAENYVPLADDVLRVRVKTLGAEEHRIPMENVNNGDEWIVYDVGGDRSQRAAWVPYFEDVNAIIFVVPACSFNQYLDEDHTVSRLTDSIDLWKSICKEKLLEKVNFILLINKMDILDEQLRSGIKFSKYVKSFKDKKNDADTASRHLFEMFKHIHDKESPETSRRNRSLWTHRTVGIDSKRTAVVLQKVREVILVRKLKESRII